MHRTIRAKLVALLLVPLLLLVACGGDDDTGTSASADPGTSENGSGSSSNDGDASDLDPDGVLRLGSDFTASGGLSLDPIEPTTPTAFWLHYLIYDTLLRQNEDGSYEPGLAKEATIVDPQTISIVLQEDVVFHDGEPLTADAVKQSIERTVASENAGGHRMAELAAIDEIEVTDETSLTIHLSTPTAGSFFNLLAHNETLVVSPKALADGVDLSSNPVGAGPFRFVSYSPESTLVLEKFDDYFAADDIRIAGVEIVQVAGPAATINALRSGTIDSAPANFELRQQVQGTELSTRADPSEALYWGFLQCRAGNPALQDVRVRQALNYATDKDAINNLVFGGDGEIMSQFFPSSSPIHNPELEPYPHDPEKARDLLAEAGYEDLTIVFQVEPQGGRQTLVGEVIQQQWAEAGIDVELTPSNDAITDFFINGDMDIHVNVQTRVWTDKLTRTFVEGSVGANCIPTEEEFLPMVEELRGLDPQDDRAVELWHEIQALLHEGAYGLYLLVGTFDNIWDDNRIGDISWRSDQVGLNPIPDVHKIYIKK